VLSVLHHFLHLLLNLQFFKIFLFAASSSFRLRFKMAILLVLGLGLLFFSDYRMILLILSVGSATISSIFQSFYPSSLEFTANAIKFSDYSPINRNSCFNPLL